MRIHGNVETRVGAEIKVADKEREIYQWLEMLQIEIMIADLNFIEEKLGFLTFL